MLELVISIILMQDPDIKICKNFKTGEVIVVEAGMPCPFPTVQI